MPKRTNAIRTRLSLCCWRRVMGAAALGAIGLAASSALAQAPSPAPRPIAIGESITSEIDTGDRQVDSQYTEEFTLQATGGQRVRIDMDATGAAGDRPFDTYLRLFDEGGTQLSFNDDRRDGTLNSRLIFEVPQTGSYKVMAQGFASRTGTYRLSVTLLPPAPAAQTIAPGRHPIVLDATAGVQDNLGEATHYRDFEFDGTEGDRIYLRATPDLQSATAAQPASTSQSAAEADLADAVTVDLTLSEGGGEVGTASGLPGFDDPRLVAILPRTGRYRLRASAPLGSDIRLSLSFDRRTAGSTPAVRALPRAATSATGQLSLDSDVYYTPSNPAAVGSLADVYALQIQQNETVIVTVSSTDFDPVLDAGTLSILGYATAWTNNDSDGFNSRLELRAARSGIVHLRVRSSLPAVGEYAVRIERRRASAPESTPAAR